ncbi:MAG: hypothetical protein WKF54_01595 [Nocardioidaceae bacterium]
MQSLPDSARVACWLNAWLTGRESADAVITGLNGRGRLAEFAGPEAGSWQAPALFLGELRRRGVRRASSALPVPGDPLGLAGPAAFNADALEAGGGVVLHGSRLGMVPVRAGGATTWHLSAADEPTYLPAVAEADRALRAAMTETADALASLDVASWQPDVADALLNLRRPVTHDEPAPFASPRAAQLADDAIRAVSIVSLARTDDGGSVSASQAAQRAAALQPLDRAARAAVVAATSSLDGR